MPFVFVTNYFALLPLTITQLYRMCWRKTQSSRKSGSRSRYIPVALVEKRLNPSVSLCQIRPIPSPTMFERMPIDQLLIMEKREPSGPVSVNQANFFE